MLKTKDMFILSAIVDKMELDVDIKELLAARKHKDVNDEEMGEKLIFSIVRKIHKAKAEITQLLANVSGKTAKEVDDLELKETMDLIKQVLQEEGVMDFLSQ